MSWIPSELARRIRIDVVNMTSQGRSSHVGSALGLADIIAVLYGQVMNVRPSDPDWADRDRLILSKGHAGSAIYSVLAARGFFDPSLLTQHCADGSVLSGHVSSKSVPGVEFSTGSLGHGLGVAAGMALASKLRGRENRVFCILSDGECDEGSVWEAALFAGHHALTNLVVVIDYNKLQSLGSVDDTLRLEPLGDKWTAFGWRVLEVPGHDIDALTAALDCEMGDSHEPTVVLAHTTKGRGVSFMEGSVLWHYRSPQGDEFDAAIAELEEAP